MNPCADVFMACTKVLSRIGLQEAGPIGLRLAATISYPFVVSASPASSSASILGTSAASA